MLNLSTYFYSAFTKWCSFCSPSPIHIDQWNSDRKPVFDRRKEAYRAIERQAEDGGAERRECDTPKHS